MGKYAPRNAEGDHRVLDDDPRAIALLKEEHHIFRELFDKGEEAEGEALKTIADELCLRLTVHMTIEEEILYPALKPILGADEIDEGIVEHWSGKQMIAQLEQEKGTEELFKSKVHVLGEETVHHIDEEDEEMFAEAREAHKAGKIDLDTLGDQLRARQAELYRQVEEMGEVGSTDEADANEIETV